MILLLVFVTVLGNFGGELIDVYGFDLPIKLGMLAIGGGVSVIVYALIAKLPG
jgi:hypothetical protein